MPGTFSIKNTIDVPPGKIISGSGQGRTKITQPKNTAITIGKPMIWLNNEATCQNLTLDGNGWTDKDIDTNGIKLEDYAILQNCEVKEVRQYAVWTYGAVGAKILHNNMHHTKYPFAFTGGSKLSDNCLGFGNLTYHYDYYIKVRYSKNCYITNNLIRNEDKTASGISLNGEDGPYYNIQVTSNILIDLLGTGLTAGIYVQKDSGNYSKDVLLRSNLILGFNWGIRSEISNVSIENNYFVNSRQAGIWINGENNSVTGNIMNGSIVEVEDSVKVKPKGIEAYENVQHKHDTVSLLQSDFGEILKSLKTFFHFE